MTVGLQMRRPCGRLHRAGQTGVPRQCWPASNASHPLGAVGDRLAGDLRRTHLIVIRGDAGSGHEPAWKQGGALKRPAENLTPTRLALHGIVVIVIGSLFVVSMTVPGFPIAGR